MPALSQSRSAAFPRAMVPDLSGVQAMTLSEFERPMESALSLATIRWASTHDWYVGPTRDGRGVVVCDRWVNVITGEEGQEFRTFYNRAALRDFAGY